MKKFLCLVLAAMTIALCSCSSEQTGETGETTEYLESETEVDPSFKPDVIVVNHGTNDNAAANDTTFIMALKDALECLMEKYPDTPIFYMMPFSQRSVGAIQKTLDTYFADADITVVDESNSNDKAL